MMTIAKSSLQWRCPNPHRRGLVRRPLTSIALGLMLLGVSPGMPGAEQIDALEMPGRDSIVLERLGGRLTLIFLDEKPISIEGNGVVILASVYHKRYIVLCGVQ